MAGFLVWAGFTLALSSPAIFSWLDSGDRWNRFCGIKDKRFSLGDKHCCHETELNEDVLISAPIEDKGMIARNKILINKLPDIESFED